MSAAASTGGRAKRRGAAPIKKAQIGLIHVARQQCHLEEDEYRQLLQDVAGVQSSAALDAKGFRLVMARFKAIGFVSKSNASGVRRALAPMGTRPGMATDKQAELLANLWGRYASTDDARALGRWLERSYGVSDIRFATLHTAQMAIEGLKAMVARGERATAAEGQQP